MKKNIGNNLALYPTPLAVVGTIVNNKPNYVLVGHLGIIGHDRVMVSLSKTHYTNQGIKRKPFVDHQSRRRKNACKGRLCWLCQREYNRQIRRV